MSLEHPTAKGPGAAEPAPHRSALGAQHSGDLHTAATGSGPESRTAEAGPESRTAEAGPESGTTSEAAAQAVRRGPGLRSGGSEAAAPGSLHDTLGPALPTVCGAIDLGTNNCRLLIARRSADGFTVIDSFSRIVRLGEGVARTGVLAPAAMERTLAALEICAQKLHRRRVDAVRIVATEAARRARNFETFREMVWTRTGLALEVVDAREEARLSLTGCAPLLDPSVPYGLVFDIGGGSTEVMWMTTGDPGADAPPRLIDMVSVPIGVVSLAEVHGGDRVSPAGYAAMLDETRLALAGFAARTDCVSALGAGAVQMLGSSGTVTTVAGVHLGLRRYDRSRVDGSLLRFDDIRRVAEAFLAVGFEDRAANPCIGPERADLVIAGCAVLEAICALWPTGSLRVADRGVREGILFDLMAGWRTRSA